MRIGWTDKEREKLIIAKWREKVKWAKWREREKVKRVKCRGREK